MSERYSIVFKLDQYLYVPNAPILLEAGQLLKDNTNGNTLIQIKIRNVGKATIKAIKVKLNLKDDFGKFLIENADYQFLDLNLKQGEEFGSKNPIQCPNSATRKFDIKISEVLFVDGSVWKDNNEIWTSFGSMEDLSNKLSPALTEWYRRRHSIQNKFVPRKLYNLKQCGCGTVYDEKSLKCPCCGQKYEELVHDLDSEKLQSELDYYDANNLLQSDVISRIEKAYKIFDDLGEYKNSKELQDKCTEKIKLLREKEELEIKQQIKKKRRMKIVAITSSSVIIAGIIIALLINNVIIPSSKYNEAISMVESDKFDEAIVVFKELDNFSDSKDQIYYAECAKLTYLLDNERYDEFETLMEKLVAEREKLKEKESELHSDIERYMNYLMDINNTEKVSFMINLCADIGIDEYSDVEKYINHLVDINDIENACNIINLCANKGINDIPEEFQIVLNYQNGIEQMRSGELSAAIASFGSATGFKDADYKKSLCEQYVGYCTEWKEKYFVYTGEGLQRSYEYYPPNQKFYRNSTGDVHGRYDLRFIVYFDNSDNAKMKVVLEEFQNGNGSKVEPSRDKYEVDNLSVSDEVDIIRGDFYGIMHFSFNNHTLDEYSYSSHNELVYHSIHYYD